MSSLKLNLGTIQPRKFIAKISKLFEFLRMETAPVTCPTCFETFYVPLPQPEEVPCDLDYDCEVCCRPMVVQCWLEDDSRTVFAEALGMED